MQDADAPVIGIASLALPHMHQVAVAAVDSQGFVHIYTTPLSADTSPEAGGGTGSALGLSRSAPEGHLGPALNDSGGSGMTAAVNRLLGEARLGRSQSDSGLFGCCWRRKTVVLKLKRCAYKTSAASTTCGVAVQSGILHIMQQLYVLLLSDYRQLAPILLGICGCRFGV